MCYSYFENRACEFYPCHGMEHQNCLFCFCPLYGEDDCGGSPVYIKDEKGVLKKDCSGCTYPHVKENYEKIIERLK